MLLPSFMSDQRIYRTTLYSRNGRVARVGCLAGFKVEQLSVWPVRGSSDGPLMAGSRHCSRQLACRIPAIRLAQRTSRLLKLDRHLDRRLLAGRVRSATSAVEHSTSRSLGLADRRLCGKQTGRIGSRRDRHLFEFIAGRRSVTFRHLEAACRHRVFPTPSGHSSPQ